MVSRAIIVALVAGGAGLCAVVAVFTQWVKTLSNEWDR